MSFWLSLWLLPAGFVAGFINVFAGGGSLITLPLLITGFGLPSAVANGTNKVALTFGNLAGAYNFRRKGRISIRENTPYLLPLFLGSFLGSRIAITISDELFKLILTIVMIGVIILQFSNPKKWLKPIQLKGFLDLVLKGVVFFALGFYGGFIQVGMGFLFMILLSLFITNDITTLNGIKVYLGGLLAGISLLVFLYEGKVLWIPGLIQTVGYSLGSYTASHLSLKGGEKLARTVLLIAVVIMAARLTGLWDTIVASILG